jgi:hypothetical protein
MARKPVPDLVKILETISSDSGRRRSDVFRAFALFTACCLSFGSRETEYLAEAGRWERPQLNAFGEGLGVLALEMDRNPYEDLLGPIHMEWGSQGDHQQLGAFYTPQDVCRLTARLILPTDLPKDRTLTLSEPACGSAAMVLAVAEALEERGVTRTRLRVDCDDVDLTAVHMAYTNLALSGIPAVVRHRNSITLETWSAWPTPPFHLLGGPSCAPEQPVDLVLDSRGQYAMDLEVA